MCAISGDVEKRYVTGSRSSGTTFASGATVVTALKQRRAVCATSDQRVNPSVCWNAEGSQQKASVACVHHGRNACNRDSSCSVISAKPSCYRPPKRGVGPLAFAV